jgi:hypothetical protein
MKTIMDCERRPKLSFYTYRDACAPLMISLRSDRDRFFAGEAMPIELWVCNDTHEVHEGARLAWRIRQGERIVEGGSTPAVITPMESTFQGIAAFHAPQETGAVVVEAALIDRDGRTIQSAQQTFQVYPQVPAVPPLETVVIGQPSGKAERLAKALSLRVSKIDQLASAQLILVDDLALYAAHEAEITASVRNGARCVFLGVQEGTHRLVGDEIEFFRCTSHPVHFVSRDTGHPLVEGLEPNSVKFWFDEDIGYVSPLVHTTFRAEGWKSAYFSGSGGWATSWGPVHAVASKRDGEGCWIICQLDLHNRIKTNPVAARAAERLITATL